MDAVGGMGVPEDSTLDLVASMGADVVLDAMGIHWRSGKFQIVADGRAYGIHVDAGRVILATSSHRALRLGHLLLQRGAVEPLFLDDILRGRRALERDQALGRVLVRDGAVSLADLAAGVEEQCIEIISRVFALETATVLFLADDPLPHGIEVVPMDTLLLLRTAAQRQTDRSAMRAMQRLLPGPDAVLTLAVRLALVSHHLTDSELLVTLGIDRGSATLAALASSLPLEPLTLKRTVIGLLERGYLVVGSRKA